MATTTAGALIATGLRRIEFVDSPTGYIQHPASGGGEAFDYLNAALSELFDILYECDSEGYGKVAVPFSTVAGVPTSVIQTLATNSFYHLVAVEYWNGSRYIDLDRVPFAERNNYSTAGQPQGYSIEGGNLTIYPTPAAVYTMRLWHVGLPPKTSADTDSLDLQGPWDEFVWKRFAKECLSKEESDTSTLDKDLYGVPGEPDSPSLVRRIRAAAKKRDSAHPTAPIDVQDGGASAFLEPWLLR